MPNVVPPISEAIIAADPTPTPHKHVTITAAFRDRIPVIVFNPIDIAEKYQMMIGLTLYKTIVNGRLRLRPRKSTSNPIGKRPGKLYKLMEIK